MSPVEDRPKEIPEGPSNFTKTTPTPTKKETLADAEEPTKEMLMLASGWSLGQSLE